MYERMLDKKNEPSLDEIRDTIGEESYRRLCCLEESLEKQYQLTKELRFPFGNNYGWGYKYGHKSFHLCYAFFEKGAFTVTIQVGDRQVAKLEAVLDGMSQKARELWAGRYPCGDQGGWVHYRILEDADLEDILQFVHAKKAPAKAESND